MDLYQPWFSIRNSMVFETDGSMQTFPPPGKAGREWTWPMGAGQWCFRCSKITPKFGLSVDYLWLICGLFVDYLWMICGCFRQFLLVEDLQSWLVLMIPNPRARNLLDATEPARAILSLRYGHETGNGRMVVISLENHTYTQVHVSSKGCNEAQKILGNIKFNIQILSLFYQRSMAATRQLQRFQDISKCVPEIGNIISKSGRIMSLPTTRKA